MKGSCNKRWGNKSKGKGDELAGSLEQADSKFAYVSTALSTLIPNVPSWLSRLCLEKPCGEGDAAQIMSTTCNAKDMRGSVDAVANFGCVGSLLW